MSTRALIAMLLVAAAIVGAPLALSASGGGVSAFAGSDDQAKAMVGRVSPSYQPWFRPILPSPSNDAASLLFAAQAGLGCAVIGYYFGYSIGRRRARVQHASAER